MIADQLVLHCQLRIVSYTGLETAMATLTGRYFQKQCYYISDGYIQERTLMMSTYSLTVDDITFIRGLNHLKYTARYFHDFS